ncbi:glycosyltransferase family 2 protein, partial [Burkholderia cepacia]|uniref:glycosyltransferase family 2 protein n=1 Tax=Burkholderia cepacia TaxID=292 RepID=UPI0013F405E0
MHRASICAIVRNEGKYIREWIAYHSAIGFDHFYIYNNQSEDDTCDALSAASRAGVCTVVDWPNPAGGRPQIPAYRNALKTFGKETEWILCMDADELLNLKRHRSIGAFLDDYPDADAIGINWRMFGSGGSENYAPGLMMERFQLAAPVNFGPHGQTKTIARCRSMKDVGIHSYELQEGSVFVNPEHVPLKPHPVARQDHITLRTEQINHYFTKTWEEWQIKRAKGKADSPPDHPDFYRNDGE